MKWTVYYSCLILFFLSTSNTQAENLNLACSKMIGTYGAIPFTRPAGLEEAAEVFALTSLGTPIFRVENKNGKWVHIGLSSGKRVDISPTSQVNKPTIDALFGTSVTQCVYQFSNDLSIVQVDLSSVNSETLKPMVLYIAASWGGALTDLSTRPDAEERLIHPKMAKKVH